jgi:DcmR-like sensory protein
VPGVVRTPVRCESCGARFETPTPASFIERNRRCGVCGQAALVIERSATRPPAAPVAGHDVAAGSEALRLGLGDHVVHFYTRFAGLASEVGSYLAAGLADGAAVLVIATEAHTRNLKEELATRGVVDAQAGEGQGMIFLDAADMLAEITVRERVDRDAFMRVVGELLRTAGQRGRSVRVYGEMVNLLWGSGDVTGAIELERLWNELIDELGFSLLCAYHSAKAAGQEHQAATAEICRLHSSVSQAALT